MYKIIPTVAFFTISTALTPASAESGRPHGCPARAWCGCFLSKHLGLNNRSLWLARNWARIGSASSPVSGAIVVWRHHVGLIKRVTSRGKAIVLSGNDGRRVRERERTISNAIAFRILGFPHYTTARRD